MCLLLLFNLFYIYVGHFDQWLLFLKLHSGNIHTMWLDDTFIRFIFMTCFGGFSSLLTQVLVLNQL